MGWDPPGSTGSLLARSQYAPASVDTAALVAAATGLTALNFTTGGNVPSVTFTPPPSGDVVVRVRAFVKGGAAAATSVVFGVVSSTASPGSVVGVTGLVFLTPTATAGDNGVLCELAQLITGLSGSQTWYFAAMYSGTQPSVLAQGSTSQTAVPTGAPALIEVYAA